MFFVLLQALLYFDSVLLFRHPWSLFYSGQCHSGLSVLVPCRLTLNHMDTNEFQTPYLHCQPEAPPVVTLNAFTMANESTVQLYLSHSMVLGTVFLDVTGCFCTAAVLIFKAHPQGALCYTVGNLSDTHLLPCMLDPLITKNCLSIAPCRDVPAFVVHGREIPTNSPILADLELPWPANSKLIMFAMPVSIPIPYEKPWIEATSIDPQAPEDVCADYGNEIADWMRNILWASDNVQLIGLAYK